MSSSVQRRARFLVLEALYESENSSHDAEAAYDRRLREVAEDDPKVTAEGPAELGRELLRGVLAHRDEIDERIGAAATRYPVATMAVVDRNILRLAIWELLSDNSAPVAAVVNEAVELAHRYGGDSSPGFVNGVLRTVSQRIMAERGLPPPEADFPNTAQQEN